MATSVADITASIATSAPESDLLFKTSFLRDGASGKSFAIIQANDSVKSLSYTVYERSTELFGSRSFVGSIDADAPVFSFTISKGSKYWIVATINGDGNSTVHFEVDPNKRRLGVGAGKKRAAAGDAAPADGAAASSSTAAPEADKSDKSAAASSASAPKSKKIKA